MVSGGDSAYQQVCSDITEEFNNCSTQVLEMEFMKPDLCRDDLARLLKDVQAHEKQKLRMVLFNSVVLVRVIFT
ncbi:hypothetical protein GIB67_026608 [Kingdonia uniflora]|uniref:Uncharacterized protein n=1 Tax=Kingdonia uniflora TaxID=39325 RepID=A0A7J7P624_9MAGN|nr:hypothetical protein GIB67_006226 [Kingdonia uniflora]KAF6176697.1 hypothetical protein GIB67_026608 [Kingdonia uniflora]